MLTKRYYCVEGEILGDSEAGDYVRDALGSVTATCNPDTGSVWNTYRYKPYGSDLSSSGGEKSDPKFRWIGTAGYRQSSISHSASYVRSRHYGQEEGRWTSVDLLFPQERAYLYLHSDPLDQFDYSGNGPDDMDAACLPAGGSGCDPVQNHSCGVTCQVHFKTYKHRCYLKWKGKRCAVCCQCNPCDQLKGHHGDVNSALRQCLRPGESARLSGSANATTCSGKHYTYRTSPRSRVITVLCCKCHDSTSGIAKYLCKCKNH